MASVAPINPAGPIHSPGNCCPSAPASSSSAGSFLSVLTEKVRRLDSGSAAQPEGGTHLPREILHLAHTLLSLYGIYEETRAEFQTPSEPASSAAPVVANQAQKTSSKPVVRDLDRSDPRLARIWGGEELGDNTSNAGQLYDTHSYNGTTVHVFNVRGPVRVQFLREDYSGTNLTLPQLESEARQRNLVMWETTVDRDSTITLPSQYANGYINLLGGSAAAYVL
jgi:hypothetical protein